MKIAIIYKSVTGHSKKIASKIASNLEMEVHDIKINPILENIDVLFIVGGIYAQKSSYALKRYIKTITPDKVKKVALITSSATKTDGQIEIRNILKENEVEVYDEEYSCYGSFLLVKRGHPNEDEIKEAIEFAKKIKDDYIIS